MKFKDKVVCDVCGKMIIMPNARIEWNYEPFQMQLVHHECSYGYSEKIVGPLSDMILDQGLYNNNPDVVNERLNQLWNENEGLRANIDRIKNILFD